MASDVRRALGELEGARTQKSARSSLAAAAAPSEASIELGEADIVRSQYGLDESIRIPMRRSVLPWLLLLGVAGGGTKVWLDRRAKASAPPPEAPSEVASTAMVPASTTAIEGGEPSSASSAAPNNHPKSASGASPTRSAVPPSPAPIPPSSAAHHTPPRKHTPATLLKPKGH
jgi:hypothetical protein